MQLIRNCWYPILDQHGLRRGGRVTRLKRFGINLILWKGSRGKSQDNDLVCMEDRCPHKGAPLGLGKRVGDSIECPYHGIRFGADGACLHVPALGSDACPPSFLRVRTFRVREQHGWVWLWWGDAEPSEEVPFFPELVGRAAPHKAYSCKYPASFHRVMESNSDGYHLNHLHARVSPSFGTIVSDCRAEVSGRTIAITSTYKKSVAAQESIDLLNVILFPNLVMAYAKHMRTYNVIACAPIDDETTWFMVRFYNRVFDLPGIGWLANSALNLFSHYLVAPDDFAVQSWQRPKQTGYGTDKLLRAVDKGTIEYWKMLRAELALADPPQTLEFGEGIDGPSPKESPAQPSRAH